MRRAQPPILATWLYERLAAGPAREALAGDLIEQYATGRSRAWYWRQVLSAIIVGLVNQLRDNSVLALRGLVVGWTVLLTLRSFARPVFFAAAMRMRDALVDWTFFSMNWRSTFGSIAAAQLVELPFSLAFWVTAAVAGWSVGRLHRKQQTAVVLLFVLTVALQQGALRLLAIHQLFTGPSPIQSGQWQAVRGLLIASAVQAIVGLICTLTAGLWGARTMRAEVPVSSYDPS